MENDEIDRLIKVLEAEKVVVARDLDALQRRDSALTRAISGLVDLRDDDAGPPSRAPATPNPTTPRGIEAIKRVLVEASEPMDTRKITEELARRGWAPRSGNPANATSSNASRAFESVPEIRRERDESGHFRYRWVDVDIPDDREEGQGFAH